MTIYNTVAKVTEALPSLGLETGSKELPDILSSLFGGQSPIPVRRTQTITAAGAIDLTASYVSITGPAASTYAITLAAPDRPGRVMVIEMVATTATNAVTLALTNVIGGSAAASASFDAALETIFLVSTGSRWIVAAQTGVTLT